MTEQISTARYTIPDDTLKKWQNILDTIAALIGIPAALIMRLVEPDIEVLVSSESDGNPYHPGDHEYFPGSGLYCETVINTNDKLLVPNALADEKWKRNPDVKLDMISYLGYPIIQPDGKPFGTICVLDNKENVYSETYENLITNFRDIIQMHLELIYMNRMLGGKNRQLNDYISEIETLRGIIPICSKCKKIRDDSGYWQRMEKYIEERSKAEFSHGLCPECLDELYGSQDWYQKQNKD